MNQPTPGMVKPIRHVQLYGYLVERNRKLFHPRGTQPLCGAEMASQMIEAGWLVKTGDRYVLTPEAQRWLA